MAETSSYPTNKGEIASPNNDAVVTSLKEANGGKNSTPVNHNEHVESFNKGASIIETPATGIITRGK